MKDDEECLETIRDLVGKLGPHKTAGFNRKEAKLPSRSSAEIFDILPESRTSPYDMNELLECIIDEDSFTEFKRDMANL